jgi:hypothetical protein
MPGGLRAVGLDLLSRRAGSQIGRTGTQNCQLRE